VIERRWMERAVELAPRSLEEGTYPIGAVLTDAEGRNRVLPTGDPYGGGHRILQAQSHYDRHRGRDLAREIRALMRRWEGLRGRLGEFPWPEPEEAR
jgi:tRNA(Arg) A34 adenosine deaminase TadA